MPNHLRVRSLALLLAGTFLMRNVAAGQGTIGDRIRKIADDEKKALLADANRQVNSVVTDAAAANVAEGTFSAAFSPWTSSKKGDKLVFLGQEQDGYLHVSNGTSEGWVRKVLVSKR